MKNLQSTKETTRLVKLIRTSEFNPPKFVEERIPICNSDSHHLVASFTGAPAGLASQRKAQLEHLILDLLTTKSMSWEASGRKWHKFIIDGSKQEVLTRNKLIVTMVLVAMPRFLRYEKIKCFTCSYHRNVTAMF